MCFVRAGMGGRRKASLALNLEELLTQGDLFSNSATSMNFVLLTKFSPLRVENKTIPGSLSLMVLGHDYSAISKTKLVEASTSFADIQL
ncbi:hypothetical protein BDZ91DRAFT_720798 [Kalaharituber pfeilii]|nr:hypothetical protein BDZ91DRAFT_720798 [Kalaharituber pfeilii]